MNSITVTGKTGPGITVTDIPIRNLQSFSFDCDNLLLSIAANDLNSTFSLDANTDISINIANGNFTVVVGSGSEPEVSLIHQATVELDNDVIKTLPDGNTHEVIAALGENKVIIYINGTARLFNQEGYDIGDASGSLAFLYDDIIGTLASVYTLHIDDFATQGTYGWIIPIYADPTEPGFPTVREVLNRVSNKGLMFKMYASPTDPFTLGHANNTLKLMVAYMILDLTTGLFE